MNDQVFDSVTREATGGISRRMSLKMLGAAGFAAVLASPFVADAKQKHKKHKKRRKHRAAEANPSAPASPPVTSPLQLAFDCPAPGSGEGNFQTGSGARVAQTFTASRSGRLRQIQIGVTKPANSAGDYVVQLLRVQGNGVPSQTGSDILAAVTIPDAAVKEGDTTLVADFTDPVLVAGTVLAAVVGRLDAPGASDDLVVRLRQGVACGGQLFFESDEFNAQPDFDMIVSVFVV